jgi:hypothetical protein
MHVNPAFFPDLRYLDSSGTLVKVNASGSPLAFAQTTLSGAHSTGATSLTVASIAGCSNGYKIQAALPLKPGAAQAIYIGTVNGVPSGSSIPITPSLPRGAASGTEVVCFSKAGSRPATWINPIDYATK